MMETRIVNRLSLGKREVYDLAVIAVSDHPYQDVDGLMPTSLFHSIFISHQGKVCHLEPIVPEGKPIGQRAWPFSTAFGRVYRTVDLVAEACGAL